MQTPGGAEILSRVARVYSQQKKVYRDHVVWACTIAGLVAGKSMNLKMPSCLIYLYCVTIYSPSYSSVFQDSFDAKTTKNHRSYGVTSLRGYLHGAISARTEILARLLTYGDERNNLNKKSAFLTPHIVFVI